MEVLSERSEPVVQIQVKEVMSNADRLVGEILRALPEWFGLESAIVDYCNDARRQTTYSAAASDGRKVGFVMLKMNNKSTAEVNVMAVLPEFHGSGIGKALLKAAEVEALRRGRQFMLIKTLGPSEGDHNYLRTFDFYLRNGYVLLDEFEGIWRGCHCALLTKKL